jgi:hypothetical protein
MIKPYFEALFAYPRFCKGPLLRQTYDGAMFIYAKAIVKIAQKNDDRKNDVFLKVRV